MKEQFIKPFLLSILFLSCITPSSVLLRFFHFYKLFSPEINKLMEKWDINFKFPVVPYLR